MKLLVKEGSVFCALEKRGVVQKPTTADGLTLEAWSSGYLVGALVIMGCITIANMRKAWMKVKPFLPRAGSHLFIWTLILAQSYWVMEVYANFAYFHGRNELFLKTRPWEALCRDPWWIFANSILFWKIKTQYEMTVKEIITTSPRFGIMMLAAFLSVVFFVLDIITVTNTLNLGLPSGINPFWKVSSVFKCLMDCVILDDFKTAVDRLRAYKDGRIGSYLQDINTLQTPCYGDLPQTWEEIDSHQQRRSEAIDFGGSPLVGINHSSNVETIMRNPA
ncbi:hypothetical protein N0V90_013256 [Kalmusia sp. IMI 367209]|nr:hypothetical protein N0V90_013256 [Kalmusia sp. IMI 367209]